MGNLIFIGDIHQNFAYLKWYAKQRHLENASIIQLGDWGLGFNDYNYDIRLMDDLNKFFEERNIHTYALRGNHDDPFFWDGHLDNKWTNLHLVKDYTILNICGYDIFFCGGSISIDRKYRLNEMQMYARNGQQKNLYWFDEKFVLNEEKLKEVKGVDIVVTHTAPDFCFPQNVNGKFAPIVDHFAYGDPTLKDELMEERLLVTKMWEILKENNFPRMWLYGHFHNTHMDTFDGCDFRLLNINEAFEYRGKDYEDELNKLYGE